MRQPSTSLKFKGLRLPVNPNTLSLTLTEGLRLSGAFRTRSEDSPADHRGHRPCLSAFHVVPAETMPPVRQVPRHFPRQGMEEDQGSPAPLQLGRGHVPGSRRWAVGRGVIGRF